MSDCAQVKMTKEKAAAIMKRVETTAKASVVVEWLEGVEKAEGEMEKTMPEEYEEKNRAEAFASPEAPPPCLFNYFTGHGTITDDFRYAGVHEEYWAIDIEEDNSSTTGTVGEDAPIGEDKIDKSRCAYLFKRPSTVGLGLGVEIPTSGYIIVPLF